MTQATTTTTDQGTLRVIVDGTAVELAEGASLLDAVQAAGVALPHLCKDADGPALGACRTCLVQVEGVRGMPASCYTPAVDGMVVDTQGEDVVAVRKGVLELTLAMQDDDATQGESELSQVAATHDVQIPAFASASAGAPTPAPAPTP